MSNVTIIAWRRKPLDLYIWLNPLSFTTAERRAERGYFPNIKNLQIKNPLVPNMELQLTASENDT
jgi:hypothetical protein